MKDNKDVRYTRTGFKIRTKYDLDNNKEFDDMVDAMRTGDKDAEQNDSSYRERREEFEKLNSRNGSYMLTKSVGTSGYINTDFYGNWNKLSVNKGQIVFWAMSLAVLLIIGTLSLNKGLDIKRYNKKFFGTCTCEVSGNRIGKQYVDEVDENGKTDTYIDYEYAYSYEGKDYKAIKRREADHSAFINTENPTIHIDPNDPSEYRIPDVERHPEKNYKRAVIFYALAGLLGICGAVMIKKGNIYTWSYPSLGKNSLSYDPYEYKATPGKSKKL